MKEKTVHSMKIFNFSCHIENKIMTFLQLIVKNFHLRCGLIGCNLILWKIKIVIYVTFLMIFYFLF